MSTPSTFAQKRRHLPWSKLYADAWLRVRNSSISVGAMLTWVDLQLLFIQSEKPGCLIEQGQPIPIKSLALRLGKKESKLEREIEELVQIGVLSQNASIGISDIRMTIDEAATSYETGRKTIRGKSRIKATNSYSGFPNTRPREEQEQEREQE